MSAVLAGGAGKSGGDASAKTILGRGCDPVLAARSSKFLPPMLGNCGIVTATNDDDWLALLKARKYDVIFFAPGACRWSKAKMPIPGGVARTSGWSLDDYIREAKLQQGDDVPIAATEYESEIVPILRNALGLPPR